MTTQNLNSAPVDVVEEKQDLYQQVTNTIISQMEKGVALWHKPWVGNEFNPFVLPKNQKSGKSYNGINILLLWSATIFKDFKSHEWASFKQWNEQGYTIGRGEKGTMIVYYDTFEKEEDGEIKKIPFLRSSVIFNKCQLSNYTPTVIPVDEMKNKVERLDAVERFVEKTKAKIVNEGVSAKYVPSEDKIYMPPRSLFVQSNELTATEAYYATLAHELGHWTGHKDRVGREFGTRFGNQTYAFEELIAELSAAFLCAELEITNHPRETHASYLTNWLEVMKSDKKAIFTAASYATKAVSYLKNLQAFNL